MLDLGTWILTQRRGDAKMVEAGPTRSSSAHDKGRCLRDSSAETSSTARLTSGGDKPDRLLEMGVGTADHEMAQMGKSEKCWRKFACPERNRNENEA